jgi:serine/threonine protein kinase
LVFDENRQKDVVLRITPFKAPTAQIEPEVEMLGLPDEITPIVAILGWKVVDGFQAVATEYCRGGALSHRLKVKSKTSCWPLNPVVALDLIAQVCGGLAVIHAQGHVHGNLNPANILLTEPFPEFGVAKLAEYGIDHRCQTGFPASIMQRRLPYMAPELLTGQDATARSDIYSVGITLYRVVTGKLPFDASLSQQDCVKAKVRGDLIPISSSGDVDVRLQRIIMHAVEVDPSKRHGSALEIQGQLIALLIDLSVEQALRLFRQTVDFQQADRTLSDLCARFPTYARPYLALAKLCVQVGLAARAARVYQAASKQILDNTELLFEMAQFKQTVENETRAAIVYMRQAIKQDVGQLDRDHRLRAEVLLKQWLASLQGSTTV